LTGLALLSLFLKFFGLLENIPQPEIPGPKVYVHRSHQNISISIAMAK
jgi:hypothetical protein